MTLINSIIRFAFYVIMSGVGFYSFLAIYSLLRFSNSKIVAFAAGGVYVYLLLTLFTTAVIALNKINF